MIIIKGNDLIEKFGMDYFQEISIFGALSPKVIEYLLDKGKVYCVDKGEVIYKPGDKGNYFLVILSGSVSFYQYHHGEYAYIRDHLFGEELGFVAMIALHDRVGKAVAAEESHILEVPCALFSELQRQHPADFGILLLNLSREMARTIRDISNTIVDQKIAQRLT
jgi:CRP-like cAMP-binding protein